VIRNRPPPAGAEPMRTHQAGDPLAAHPLPALPELGVHARTAIAPAGLGVNRLNLDAEPLILLGPARRGARVPRVEAGAGSARVRHSTRNGIGGPSPPR